MIYVYNDSLDMDSVQLKKGEKLLSRERIEKMNRYKFQKDKTLCMIAFLLMRYGLEKEFGISYIPRICTTAKGKLFFEKELLCFNLSHCDTAVGCVIDKKQVGIDVQNYTDEIIKIRNDFLTQMEAKKVFVKKDCIRELTAIWTLKEAYGKYYGDGLNYPFVQKDFSFIENNTGWQNYEDLKIYSRQFTSYALSVCSKQSMPIQIVRKKNLMDFVEREIRL